jgi:DNA-binding IclR family transcriptional regulator
MELSSDIWNTEDSSLPRKPRAERPELETRHALGVRDRQRVAQQRPAGASARPDTPVGVIDRAAAVMDAVEAGARSFTDIVRVTGLTRPTAHRLIRSLEDHGYLFHVGGLGYALGPRLLGLATAAMRELPLRELAHPALERLARTTGESAQLFVRDGDRRICVDAVDSEHELRTIVEVGAALPLTQGSAGKVFLAWGPSVEGDDMDRLGQQLATTRRRGWADSFGERAPGVASVSAPVFGPGDAVLAAISVSGPASRIAPLRAKAYAPAVMQAAGEVESALGG